jgi:hypothetical protein
VASLRRFAFRFRHEGETSNRPPKGTAMVSIADKLRPTARLPTGASAAPLAGKTAGAALARLSTPAADHYVVNRESGRVSFGDGAYGRRPPSGPPPSGAAEGEAARELVSVKDLIRYAAAAFDHPVPDHQVPDADPGEPSEPPEG